MQAIREIRKVDSETITINVPEEFIGKYVEIVILPYDEPEDEAEHK
ncbi:MAG: hypothetical protein GTO45_31005 [Candidatus Aminicenantes bacterium]|nr:hypothetical protein [Candidatus Aminicenantes bacterium]NIM83212.1 hypothetical protein [Candidatus Aminicenantes bacterium]NIN22598.1 hypothetical protein [Candidatus Aminicenantes bacterium]NIN46360.1 hypothetical protein [Candidatus Aminicenantes bacterium]NIN89208.1 hypothetical protein [Candidatus Aminicenantes bacterium]